MYIPIIRPGICIADENSEYADTLNILRDKLLAAERVRDQLFLTLAQLSGAIKLCEYRVRIPQRYAYAAGLAVEDLRSDDELAAVQWPAMHLKDRAGQIAYNKAREVRWYRQQPNVSLSVVRAKITRLVNKKLKLTRAQTELQARVQAAEQLCQEVTTKIDKVIAAQEEQRVVYKYKDITNSELLYTYNRAVAETPYKKTKEMHPDFLCNELAKVLSYRAEHKVVV